ncbi:uncharacterized protein LOC119314254 [Triticum dicoccoides]|uniref:uncharacterized protein LOC119314254 n=2 Tax=Triticum dicoccoides TaxID=85692 RepID=UPI00188F8B61|nr:uncharacterized protein LOC119314254 [Triticum dicoccoides]
MAISLLPYTASALLAIVIAVAIAVAPAVVRSDQEPGPSIEAINATCATATYKFECTDLLLNNLDVRTPQVKDVIAMSVQVVAKKAAEAAAFAKAIKKPSKCVTDCLDDLAILSKHIKTLPATLETANDAGFFEQFDTKKKCHGDCCSDNFSSEECNAKSQIGGVFGALRVTDDLLMRRAYFRKQQLDNKTTSPNSN